MASVGLFISLWILICVTQNSNQTSLRTAKAFHSNDKSDDSPRFRIPRIPQPTAIKRDGTFRIIKSVSSSVSASVSSDASRHRGIEDSDKNNILNVVTPNSVGTTKPKVFYDQKFNSSSGILDLEDFINLVKENDDKKRNILWHLDKNDPIIEPVQVESDSLQEPNIFQLDQQVKGSAVVQSENSDNASPTVKNSRGRNTLRFRSQSHGTRLSEDRRRKLFPSRRKGNTRLLKVRPPSIRRRTTTQSSPLIRSTTQSTIVTPLPEEEYPFYENSFRNQNDNDGSIVQQVVLEPVIFEPKTNIQLKPKPVQFNFEEESPINNFITSYQQLPEEVLPQGREAQQNLDPIPVHSIVDRPAVSNRKYSGEEHNLFTRLIDETRNKSPRTKVFPSSGHFDYAGYEDLLEYAEYDELFPDVSSSEPGIFDQLSYGYKIKEKNTGNFHARQEERDGKRKKVALPDGRIQPFTYVADDGGYKAEVNYKEDENLPTSHTTSSPLRLKPNLRRQFNTTPSSRLRAAQRFNNERINQNIVDKTDAGALTVPLVSTTQRSRQGRNNGHMTPWPAINSGRKVSRRKIKRKRKPSQLTTPDPVVDAHFQTSVSPFQNTNSFKTISTPKPFKFIPIRKNTNLHSTNNQIPFDLNQIQRPTPKKIPSHHFREVAKVPPNPYIKTRRKKTTHEPIKPRPKRISNGPPLHPLLLPNFFSRPVTPDEGLIENEFRETFSNQVPTDFPELLPFQPNFRVSTEAPRIFSNLDHNEPNLQINNPNNFREDLSLDKRVFHPTFNERLRNRARVPSTRLAHSRSFTPKYLRPQGRLDFSEDFPITTPSANPFKVIIESNPLINSLPTPTVPPTSSPLEPLHNFFQPNVNHFNLHQSSHLELLKTKPLQVHLTNAVVTPIENTTPTPFPAVSTPAAFRSNTQRVPFSFVTPSAPFHSVNTPASLQSITTPTPFHSVTTPKPFHSVTTPTPFHSVTTPTPFHSVTTPTPFHSVTTPKPFHSVTTPKPFHPVTPPATFHPVTTPTSFHEVMTSPSPLKKFNFPATFHRFDTFNPNAPSIPFVTTHSPFLTTTITPLVFKYPSKDSHAQTLLYDSNKPVFLRALGQTHAIPLLLPILGSASENEELTNKDQNQSEQLLSESELKLSTSDIYPRPAPRRTIRVK